MHRMLIKDFLKMLDTGKKIAIQFTSEVEATESDFDAGMRAVVTGYKLDKHSPLDEDTVVDMYVDFANYEEYNKDFGKNTYYDSKGEPCLHWWETALYPKDKKTTEYYMLTDKCDFTLVSNDSLELYTDWQLSNFDGTYTEWLEKRLKEEIDKAGV